MQGVQKNGELKSQQELKNSTQKVMDTDSIIQSNNVFLPLPEKASETIRELPELLAEHAWIEADKEDAAQERRHGRDWDLSYNFLWEDKHWGWEE